MSVNRSFGLSFARSILSWFDSVVYFFLNLVMRTIPVISNFQLTYLYEEVQNRVFIILGIFMLFKVTVSFLNYLVNPDKMNDKEQGVGKLVTRIIISLVMLIAINPFFDLLIEVQNQLIPVIPRIVVGQTGGSMMDEDGNLTMDAIGDQMSMAVYRAFVKDNEGCGTTITEETTVSDLVANINKECGTATEKYQYEYFPIIPFVVGAIMIIITVGISIDIAVRAIKLILLRAMAPIAILSYIDPKASKDGAFNNWTKMLFSTWLSLFINLGIIYGILTLISMVIQQEFWASLFGGINDGGFVTPLVVVMIIIALLFFAREIPRFVMNALGIKEAGSFGKMLGMAAAGLGMVGATRAAYNASRSADEALGRNHNMFRNVGAGLFGGIAGGMAGGAAALGAKDHNMKAAMDALSKHNSMSLARGGSGSTFAGRLEAGFQQFVGGETEYDRLLRVKQGNEAANKALLQYKNTMEKKALEKTNLFTSVQDNAGNTYTGLNYLEFTKNLEGAQNGDARSLEYFKNHGFVDANGKGDWQSAALLTDKLKDSQTQLHASNMVSLINSGNMAAVQTSYGTEYNDYRLAADAVDDIGMSVDFSTYGNASGTGVKQSLGKTNTAITDIVTNPRFKAAEANAKATKK